MPFREMVQDFNARSRYQIRSDEIRNRVEAAMQLGGGERDNAIKQIMLDLFPDDARNQERIRMKAHAQLRSDPDMVEDYMLITDHHSFLTTYVNVIRECAKDIDPAYEPPFMLGLEMNEVKRLQNDRIQSYTLYDDARYVLLHTRGLAKCMEDIERARYSNANKRVNYYPDTKDARRAAIEDVYIYKQILREELGKKSIFWKIFHPFKTYEMRSFIKTAEKALNDVHFMIADGVQVSEKYNNQSATPNDDLPRIMGKIDDMYEEHKKHQSAIQNSVAAQSKESTIQQISVDIKNPLERTEISEPVVQERSLEKSGIQIG